MWRLFSFWESFAVIEIMQIIFGGVLAVYEIISAIFEYIGATRIISAIFEYISATRIISAIF